jgi:hypothetical protein
VQQHGVAGGAVDDAVEDVGYDLALRDDVSPKKKPKKKKRLFS